MSSLTASEAFEILRFAQQYVPRLEQASDLLEAREAPEAERGWLEQAVSRLNAELAPAPTILERARALPDLAEAIQALATEDQGRWVDTLEKLVAGITFTASSRSPLIEALLPNQKWPALRRASREDVSRYQAEFERRAKTSYVTRMLGSDDMAVVRPVMDQVSAAYARWFACFSPAPLDEGEAQAIRTELRNLAERVDLAVRQSRLLAEAALLGSEGALEELGLHAKPKKRAARGDIAAELAMMADSMDANVEAARGSEESVEPAAEENATEASPGETTPPTKPSRRSDGESVDPGGSEAAPPKKPRKKRANPSEGATAAPAEDPSTAGAPPSEAPTDDTADTQSSAEA